MNIEERNEFNTFTKPEKPFLLLYETNDKRGVSGNWQWLQTEEEAQELVDELRKEFGDKLDIVDCIEIHSNRAVEIG